MPRRKTNIQYVLCICNDAYPASLELRKVYQTIPDQKAAQRHLVRVIDESGEDYLYPESLFIPIEVPAVAEPLFVRIS